MPRIESMLELCLYCIPRATCQHTIVSNDGASIIGCM